MVAVGRMWLVCKEVIGSPGFSPIRKYCKFMVWRKAGSVRQTRLGDASATKAGCDRSLQEAKARGENSWLGKRQS